MPIKVEGPLKTLLLSLTALALVILVGTFIGPLLTEYEVKTAARIACNDYRKELRAGEDKHEWEKTFVGAARRAAVQLQSNQYDFELGGDSEVHTCRIRVKWFENVPVFLLSDATDIKPIKYLHSIDYTHSVKRKY